MIVFLREEPPTTVSIDGSNVIGASELTFITSESELVTAIMPKSPAASAPEPPNATIALKIAETNRSIPTIPHVTYDAPTPENPPWPSSCAN